MHTMNSMDVNNAMDDRKKRRRLIAGVLFTVYFAVLFLVSFAVQKGMPEEPVKIFTTLVLCGASGMAGGMIG